METLRPKRPTRPAPRPERCGALAGMSSAVKRRFEDERSGISPGGSSSTFCVTAEKTPVRTLLRPWCLERSGRVDICTHNSAS